MPDPTFVKTRFDYYEPANGFGSYQDYWRMVELSHFPTCYVDEIDHASDNTYIITPINGEVPIEVDGTPIGWPDTRARIIHWNLEQDGYPTYPGINETWVSDARLAELTGAKYVLMGGHEGLRYPGEVERDGHYHVAMLAYMTPRRNQIAADLEALDMKIAPNGWHQARHIALISSSAMLQVHQNDGKNYCAPQRFALAAAYSLPMISETLDHPGAFGHKHLLRADYAYLADFVKMWTCRNEARTLEGYGRSLHQFLCHERPFRKNVEDAL